MSVAWFLAAMTLAAPPVEPGQPRSFVFVRGVCEQLLLGAIDQTEHCQGSLVVSDYTNGRVNVAFVLLGDRGIIGFSGQDLQREPQGARVRLPLDRVVMSEPGDPVRVTEFQGEGRCEWSDLDQVSGIVCELSTSDGRIYRGRFETDGLPSSRVDF